MELDVLRRLAKQISDKRDELRALETCGMMEEVAKAYQELSTLEAKFEMTKTALYKQICARVPEGKQRLVLIYRYVGLEKFSSIENEMCMSASYVQKLHNEGKKKYEAGGG